MTGTPSVTCTLTVSVDGYFAGPDDEPGRGLGRGGERLHYWVFGGPWTYEQEAAGEMRDRPSDVDREFLSTYGDRPGAVICGRTTYESSGAWGGRNPFGVPLFVVTHRTDDQPDEDAGFRFVPSFEAALAQATETVGDDGVVNVMGGGATIRQALDAGVVDRLVVSTAPVVLGRGKRLFDGFTKDVDLRKVRVWDSPFATHVEYEVVR
ncbi:MAG TPA: dihydrofolate reductase family protein [Nocardioides sp.]|nr:dihydrofolate reductase family protein [uncultured Nocardioides sp.]HEX5986947.1 dihydrofolate reductase family protein [Nocardioides sp.]